MFTKPQTIYCIGIGGIGVSGLAQLLQADGHTVSGSDIRQSAVTDQVVAAGISVSLTQDGSGVPADCDVVIYSDAVPEDHPERVAAVGTTQLSYFEALGQYAKQFTQVVAVSGTHGKSTTTAMLGSIVAQAGLNPTVLVGSLVPQFGSNVRHGGKELFVVEACEHNAHMLHIPATHIVVTNIEAEHLDFYRDLDHIIETFQKFTATAETVVVNSDDPASQQLTSSHSFSFSQASNLRVQEGRQLFTVDGNPYSLVVPGQHNVLNALGAIQMAEQLGVDAAACQAGLAAYQGIWRRFELLCDYRKAIVVSDYAHHPTEIAATVAAARDFFPDRRVVVVFQPHLRSRTKELLSDFATSLATADFAIIQEIFDVAGREQDIQVSSRDIVEQMEDAGTFPVYTPDADATLEAIDDIIDKKDVLLVMGAGNIYQLAESLC